MCSRKVQAIKNPTSFAHIHKGRMWQSHLSPAGCRCRRPPTGSCLWRCCPATAATGSSSCFCTTQRSWTGSGPASGDHWDTTRRTRVNEQKQTGRSDTAPCHRFWTDLKGAEQNRGREEQDCCFLFVQSNLALRCKPLRPQTSHELNIALFHCGSLVRLTSAVG